MIAGNAIDRNAQRFEYPLQPTIGRRLRVMNQIAGRQNEIGRPMRALDQVDDLHQRRLRVDAVKRLRRVGKQMRVG